MSQRLFGLETEYGIAATTRAGEPVENRAVALELLGAAPRCLPCVPACKQGGVFLGNGSRFYVDCGDHPELATPEVSTPEAAVTYAAAGDRILARLAADVARTQGWRVMLLRGNVDYEGGVTFGRHESYLHLAAAEDLAQQLMPHLVSRVIYGAGGFDPKSPGIEFSLSPRSAFFSNVISDNSTGSRGIIHTKNEPLNGLGYRRFHVICPGDTLLSQTGIYLHVASTALLVALVDAGERPGDAVRLAAPVAALRTFAADPACRSEAGLEGGGSASALAIQRHYLQWAERRLPSARLPAWASSACARWRATLDRLERGPDAVAGTLDWATKLTVYGEHARDRGFGWDALAFWTEIARSLQCAMKRAKVDNLTCEQVVGSNSPIRGKIESLAPNLEQRGESWDRLRRFVDLRQEFFEIDTRWGELGEAGIWAGLDRNGLLSHRVLELASIDAAVTAPPAAGRAKLRGELIQAAHAGGASGVHADWDLVVDETERRICTLSDPFATEAVWHAIKSDAERERPPWADLLRRELQFARDQPEAFLELSALARARAAPAPPSLDARLMRRIVAIAERFFRADHPIVAGCLRDLAGRLGGESAEAATMIRRAQAIDRLNACRRDMGANHPEVALACNELAICLRSLGLAAPAEQLLREAVRIEERALSADHPKLPHRLSNLASVLLMQGKRRDARARLHRAWQLKAGQHDLTSARILCLRLALAWLGGQRAEEFIGQLKTLLAEPRLGTRADISTTWDVAAVFEALRPRLAEERLVLLQRIAAALNDRSTQPALEDSPDWRDAPSVPLDAPWPKRRRSAPATVPQPYPAGPV